MRLGPELLERDLYALLGVLETASREEIRAAHRRLAAAWHPDRHLRDRARAERLMVEFNVAVSVLLDPPSRVAYDRARDTTRRRTTRGGRSAAQEPNAPATERDDGDADWVPACDPSRVQPASGDIQQLIALMRPRWARVLSLVAAEVQSWPVRRHALLLAVCLLSALELIVQAEPRSLGFAEPGVAQGVSSAAR